MSLAWLVKPHPWKLASLLREGANQLESDGEIGGLLLGEFNLGQTGACGIEWFGTGQKKGNKR